MSVVTVDRRFSGVGEDFGPRKGTLAAHLHTTEPTDPLKTTLRDAIALMVWQDRDDSAGSYNRVMCTDGVLRCMEDDHASGGINPFSSYFKPVDWLWDALPDAAVKDPNGWGPNFAAMGRRAYFDEHGWPATIIDGFARSIIEFEDRFNVNLVVDNHGEYQPGNRTDAGAIATDLVMKRYAALRSTPTLPDTALPEEAMIDKYIKTLVPIINRSVVLRGEEPDGAGATGRYLPIFDSNDYNAYKHVTHLSPVRRRAIGWVEGTNLSLSDGTVYDARTRWVAVANERNGILFYHERDASAFEPIELVPADCSDKEATIDQQAQRIADLLTALGQKDSALATKNLALDEAIAAEKAHAPLSTKLVAARKA